MSVTIKGKRVELSVNLFVVIGVIIALIGGAIGFGAGSSGTNLTNTTTVTKTERVTAPTTVVESTKTITATSQVTSISTVSVTVTRVITTTTEVTAPDPVKVSIAGKVTTRSPGTTADKVGFVKENGEVLTADVVNGQYSISLDNGQVYKAQVHWKSGINDGWTTATTFRLSASSRTKMPLQMDLEV